jgi:membrane-associated phospholipid phosphatase
MRRDTEMLLAVQRRAGDRSVRAASALSRAGDHAATWLLVGAAGAALDAPRRPQWVEAVGTVLAAHAASVVCKRVVRRVRPTHSLLVVHVAVPSRWSFPSSHAASTTAAAIVYGRLLGTRSTAVLPPAMAWSRLALGVHYPSDVLSGAAVGAAVAALASAAQGRGTR